MAIYGHGQFCYPNEHSVNSQVKQKEPQLVQRNLGAQQRNKKKQHGDGINDSDDDDDGDDDGDDDSDDDNESEVEEADDDSDDDDDDDNDDDDDYRIISHVAETTLPTQ